MTAHLTQQRETASKCHGSGLIAQADVRYENQIAQELSGCPLTSHNSGKPLQSAMSLVRLQKRMSAART